MLVRTGDPAFAVDADGVAFHDNDTVRRLARIEFLDGRSGEYPAPNPRDGHPEGSILHWTLPMDWVIRALDRVAPSIAENARPFESGAAVSGPVLAAICEVLFALLAARFLGVRLGLAAAALHALSTSWIGGSRLGIGDHQVLQHTALVAGVLGTLAVLAGRGERVLAVAAGCALGFALWVSTESMAALVLVEAAVAIAIFTASRDERPRLVRLGAWIAIGAFAVTVLGHAIENPGRFSAFEWDRVSLFQVALVVPLLVFCGLQWRWTAVMSPSRAVVATLLGVAIAVLFLSSALRYQGASLSAANAWTQSSVAEYLPLFAAPYSGELTFTTAQRMLSVWVWVAPACAIGLLFYRALPLGARMAVFLLAVGFFALGVLELKLVHLFTIVYPIVVLAGTCAILAVGSREKRETWVAAIALVVFALNLNQVFRADPVGDEARLARRELVRALAPLEDGCVLAGWELGAHVLRDAGKPVVASGYHRNLPGIRDATLFLTATDDAAAREIAARRRVRWFVLPGNPAFLLFAGSAFGEIEPLAAWEDGAPRFTDEARASLWWRLTHDPLALPWLRLVWESPHRASWFGTFGGPRHRVYEVILDR